MPVSLLFRRDLFAGTMFLWVTFFASLLIIYLLSSWLPTLVKSTGGSLKTASIDQHVPGRRHSRRDLARLADGPVQAQHRAGDQLHAGDRVHRRDRSARSFAGAGGARGLRRGLLHLGIAGRRQRLRRELLPDRLPRDRRQLGQWRGPHRVSARVDERRPDAVDEPLAADRLCDRRPARADWRREHVADGAPMRSPGTTGAGDGVSGGPRRRYVTPIAKAEARRSLPASRHVAWSRQ